MAFSVQEQTGVFPVIYLADDDGFTVEIYSFGALLNGFTLTNDGLQFNVIDGFASPQDAINTITAGFKSAKLSPFVCRVAEGKYSHHGEEYLLNKFFLGTEAIHGLIYDAPFAIKEKAFGKDFAQVTLEHTYNKKDEGFPFQYNTKVTYALKEAGELTITTAVTNTGSSEMPLTDGWHPYFALGGSVNNLLLQLNTVQMLEFNDRLVPTGNFEDYAVFSNPKHIGDTFFDNCFTVADNGQPACTIKNATTGLKLSITALKHYPYLQVYTPPHRNSIAVENLSSAPDAFNNGIGLIIAKPGEQYIFAVSYQLQIENN